MTLETTTDQATAVAATNPSTKLALCRMSTLGGLCLLVGLTLLYLPAILPFFLVSVVLRARRSV